MSAKAAPLPAYTRAEQERGDADRARVLRALIPIDEAFRDSERKWGVGRLERLVGHVTLASYTRGWDAYRAALEAGDADAVEAVAPKMAAALAFMDAEATRSGHAPLSVETWEAPMADGTTMVIVRTTAEATAVLRGEGNLPPDLTVTVRGQHDGRRLVVFTLPEIARLVEAHGSVVAIKHTFPGAAVTGTAWEGTDAWSGVQRDENSAHDHVRSGYPLDAPLDPIAPPPTRATAARVREGRAP